MTEPPPDQPRRGALVVFLVGNVLFGAGLFVHAFLFNFYLRELGLPASVMGYQVAAMTAGGLVALLPAGLAIDRFGVRASLLAGVIVAAAGMALTALARDATSICAAAVLIGLGGATCRVSWGPALMRLTSEATRSRVFTLNVALLIAASSGWTFLAGVLPAWSARQHWLPALSGTQLVLLGGALVSALALPCYWTLAGSRPAAALPARRTLLAAPPADVARLVPLVALWMLAAALVLPFFNVLFLDRFQLPVSRIGAVFAGAQLATAVLLLGAGELARRWGARRALVTWMLALAPALWWLAATTSLPLAIALYLAQGLVAPATNPLIDQLLLERAPRDRHGVVASWRNAAAEGAGMLGASAGGWLIDAGSFATLLAVAGAVAMVGAATLSLALRARPLATPAGTADAA